MTRLDARLIECREFAKKACMAGDRVTQSGYLAEALGLRDARDGRPCDPLQVSTSQRQRYEYGYSDGIALLRLEEKVYVGL